MEQDNTDQQAGHQFDTSPHPVHLGDRERHAKDNPRAIDPAVGMVVRPMSDYYPETVHWLEPGRIALGKLNLIAGDPGLGKSFMTLELAARASRGEIGGPIGRVLIMSAEDDPCDTLLPRLTNMNADLRFIHFVEGIRREWEDYVDLPTLDGDMERLIEVIERLKTVKLIIIDPISAYMGKADSHNNAEVRAVLSRLAQLAQLSGAAVVAVTHLNKDSGNGKKAVYRTMGSLAFTAAARTVQLVTKYVPKDPHKNGENYDDEARTKRVVSMVKNNLGPMLPARLFKLDAQGIVTWLDEQVDIEADDFANDRATFEAPETKADQAVEFLERMLDAGAKPAKEVFERGAAMGLSEKVLRGAKQSMSIHHFKEGNVWYWSRDGKIDTELIRDSIEPTLDFENDGFV